MKALKDVLDNYLDLKITTKVSGKPIRAEQIAIKKTIPDFFKIVLEKENITNLFTIKGSYGEGNLANIPWIAIFHNDITKSARQGYYIVLLFSQDMSSCYLSLNQGVTNYIDIYGQSNAIQKMKKIAKHALNYISPTSNSIIGKIDLHSDGSLGKGYEYGNIEAFYYEKSNLPTPEIFEQHINILLDHYLQLVNKVGKNIQDIFAENEKNYQQISLKQAALFANEKQSFSVKEPSQATYTVTKNVRDPKVAAQALFFSQFKCEINSEHKTFISKANNLPYVEAHHLVPFNQQNSFTTSLDILPNIIALCPMCHRLLHHGKWKDKKVFLNLLLKKRQLSLEANNIFITLENLKEYYKHDDYLED